jgi:tungstate transport system permease protein
VDFFAEGFRQAISLLLGGDPETWFAIGLSLWTALLAVGIGVVVGAPLGTAVGLLRPPGTRVLAFLFRVGMSVPTVVVGLVVFGLLCRRGPLAGLDLLYTPWAIVIGQTALAIPILASLSHAAATALDPRLLETVRTHGGSRRMAVRLALSENRPMLVTATISAFGRCITELGIALVVGGSFPFVTRTLPAQIARELSVGEFGRAVAAGLILVLLACGAAVLSHAIAREDRR